MRPVFEWNLGSRILTLGKRTLVMGIVNVKQELERVIPVIQKLKQQRPKALVSVDTYKAAVARAAVEAGAEIVNDVSALRWDPAMGRTVAGLKCGVVLMHMRGRPEEWRTLAPVPDIV